MWTNILLTVLKNVATTTSINLINFLIKKLEDRIEKKGKK